MSSLVSDYQTASKISGSRITAIRFGYTKSDYFYVGCGTPHHSPCLLMDVISPRTSQISCRRLCGADMDPSAQVPHRQQDASLFATSRPGIVKRADQDGGMSDTARFFDDVDQGLRRRHKTSSLRADVNPPSIASLCAPSYPGLQIRCSLFDVTMICWPQYLRTNRQHFGSKKPCQVYL